MGAKGYRGAFEFQPFGQLRQLLAERFGHSIVLAEELYPTGLPSLDEIGIPGATVTEIVSSPASSSGGMLLLYGFLEDGITSFLELGHFVAAPFAHAYSSTGHAIGSMTFTRGSPHVPGLLDRENKSL